MRVASLDLGTNSFLCYIADINKEGVLEEVYDDSKIVRIGEGVDKTGRISQEALGRARKCIEDFSSVLKNHHVERVRATATSAARDAENSKEFVDILEQCGIPIDIISGEEEARLTYIGATCDLADEPNTLVVDGGGGSTELTFSQDNRKVSFNSLNIGAVRLKERFITSEPPSENDLESARAFVREQLSTVEFSSDINRIVAVGGTPTTLACVNQSIEFSKSRINHTKLTLAELESLYLKFLEMSVEERKKLKGLSPKRADIIPYGTLILIEVLKRFKKSNLIVSTNGVRVGVALELSL